MINPTYFSRSLLFLFAATMKGNFIQKTLNECSEIIK